MKIFARTADKYSLDRFIGKDLWVTVWDDAGSDEVLPYAWIKILAKRQTPNTASGYCYDINRLSQSDVHNHFRDVDALIAKLDVVEKGVSTDHYYMRPDYWLAAENMNVLSTDELKDKIAHTGGNYFIFGISDGDD